MLRFTPVPLRSCSRVRRAGLHLWLSPGCGSGEEKEGCYIELPQSLSTESRCESLCISVGVKCVTVASHSEVWQYPLGSYVPSSNWQQLHLLQAKDERSGEGVNSAEKGGGKRVNSDEKGGGERVKMVASGLAHTLVCGHSGRVYGSGCGYFGQTGQPGTDWSSLSLVEGLADSRVIQVASGLDHSLLLLDTGQVYACGWSADGQTGIGSYESVGQLQQVPVGPDKVVSIATCSDSSFALTESGQVFAWGNNEYGQLGVVSDQPQLPLPQPLESSALERGVVNIAAGGAFTGFLTSEGSVHVAGYGVDTQHSHSLRKVHCGGEGERVTRIAAGLNYLLALTNSTALLWGKLQLPACPSAVHYPSKLTVGSSVLKVSCGPTGLAVITDSTDNDVLSL